MESLLFEQTNRVRARVLSLVTGPLTLAATLPRADRAAPAGSQMLRGERDLGLRPDRVVFQDVLGQSAMLQFMQTGCDRVAVPTTIHCDHLIEARGGADGDLSASLTENDEVYAFLPAAAARYGAGFWGPG